MEAKKIYSRRFASDRAFRDAMWRILCRDFFQKLIRRDGALLEIGAGYCEFINNIDAAEKTALDSNPDVKQFAAKNVKTVAGDLSAISKFKAGSYDTVFASNLFEHLERPKILATMRDVLRILAPGGEFLILQPNIRFCARDYWMFFDHVTPIDDRALTEALEITGFSIRRRIERFLPFTTKSRYPRMTGLVWLYLRIPLAWRIFGQQSLIIAGKDAGA
ncbi:MAG: class I SAM-dependent methyltransferase [Anaerolineales bacterium]|nr:class I SAM-dependent methyltransferase [Anaerolineales bacterium]